MATASPSPLIDRIRRALPAGAALREVRMFGGHSFMVDNRMVVAAGRDGSLLVRVDPERDAELVVRAGAARAEMGRAGDMGAGWIRVTEGALRADAELDFWVRAALDYNARLRPGPL